MTAKKLVNNTETKILKKEETQSDSVVEIKRLPVVEVGRSFYDILDVLKNKNLSSLLELKTKYQLHDSIIKELSEQLILNCEQTKSWGYDQIVRSLEK